jgi:hypothetical protein
LILESLRAGVALLPRAWGRPWFLGLVAVGAAAALAAALVAGPAWWLSGAILYATLVYLPLAEGPLYALALAAPPERTMSGGAARYVRLVTVGLLTYVFLAVPGLLLSIVALAASYGLAFAYPGFDPKDATTWTASGPVLLGDGVVFAIGALSMFWLFARVSLGSATSVVERRVIMLSTWPLTRGLGWRIAVAQLVIGGGIVGIVWLVERAVPPGWSTQFMPVFGNILLVAVGLPLEVGVLSYFYARRSPMPVTP